MSIPTGVITPSESPSMNYLPFDPQSQPEVFDVSQTIIFQDALNTINNLDNLVTIGQLYEYYNNVLTKTLNVLQSQTFIQLAFQLKELDMTEIKRNHWILEDKLNKLQLQMDNRGTNQKVANLP
ncbi:hypothetical protein CEXT_797491 [Caerostris extrusa]|uniref:Uncharacterized protein n=1 Tax=Caerostris extrusa TaxID=172846 RepID=A0AAV4SC32_CAEEX|nr:hypothetical protein CEXT_797491 [Caerostris extrusa]